jgi:hypothetical protein
MAILLANIGTSDLALKIGEHFFPIGFDRSEPGLDYSELTDEEKKVWNNRETLIAQYFYPEIGVIPTQLPSGKYFISFREVTHKILDLYQNYQGDYQKLDQAICPIRIFGVIQKAYKLGVRKGYIFVTNQERVHHQDTIHLFEFLQQWLSNKIPNFQLIPVFIPPNLNPINTDLLLNFYHSFLVNFYQKIADNEEIFVSCKGGTPQMQNALTLQVTALGFTRLLFIDPDPKLLIKRTLKGEPPICNLKSYWRYNRQQKYQTVQQLLTRWDFDGAINIINEWQKELIFLQGYQLIERSAIEQSSQIVKQVIAMLKMAHSCWDLDIESARKVLQNCSSELSTEQLSLFSNLIDSQKYDIILNLYTQIMIYRELNQVAQFLTFLASFGEIVLYRIIDRNGRTQYLTKDDRLNLTKFRQDIGEELYHKWHYKLDQLTKNPIDTRRSMTTFTTFLLTHRQVNRNLEGINKWEEEPIVIPDNILNNNKNKIKGLKGLLDTLDYWVKQRNNLIHEGSGISVDRMAELDAQRESKACTYETIPDILNIILNHPLLQLRRDYREQFINTDQYYIYSAVKTQVIAILLSDLKTPVV